MNGKRVLTFQLSLHVFLLIFKTSIFSINVSGSNELKSMEYTGNIEQILSILKNLTKEVKQLKNEITKFEKPSSTTLHKCYGPTSNYIVHNCGNSTYNVGDYYVIDGDNGKYSRHAFCRVIIPKKIETKDSYMISSWIYNTIGPRGIHSGNIGFAFNVKDEFNFDFVYIRLHSRQSCLSTGFYQYGKIVWQGYKTKFCFNPPPRGRTWFLMQLTVEQKIATLKIDGQLIANFEPHYSRLGRGGFVIISGQQNMVRFKQYNISVGDTSEFDFFNCKNYNKIGEKYYLMEGKSDRETLSRFCAAIMKTSASVITNNYVIRVSLYNQIGDSRRESIMGVAYNAHDGNNFDFIFFKTKSTGACFNTGFLQNSIIIWSNSLVGGCIGGPIKLAEWYHVTVAVSQSYVSISLNGKHLVSTKSHYLPLARGGVITGSAGANFIAFRKFSIDPGKELAYDFSGCTENTKQLDEYYVLDAKHGKWPESTFCKAIYKNSLSVNHYEISVDLFIQSLSAGIETDFSGVMFNVVNENNYDFVHLTPHDEEQCFKAGYVINGEIQWTNMKGGSCDGARRQTGEWLNIHVVMSGNDAMVFLNERHLITYKSHFSTVGKGGVIVGNGYSNVITFRRFNITSAEQMPYTFYGCDIGSYIQNSTTYLDGGLPRQNPRTFCTAIPLENSFVTSAKYYNVMAEVYNINSWQGADWGRFGLMYNVKNEANFDFVLYNLQRDEDGDCFQYGRIINSTPYLARDVKGLCKIKIPANKWLQLNITVTIENNVSINLGDVNLGTYETESPFIANGGVILPNGNKNLIMFKGFSVVLYLLESDSKLL